MPSPKKLETPNELKALASGTLPTRGRRPNQPTTIKFLVFTALQALHQVGKLDQLNREELSKLIRAKCPHSRFRSQHVGWYLSCFRRKLAEDAQAKVPRQA